MSAFRQRRSVVQQPPQLVYVVCEPLAVSARPSRHLHVEHCPTDVRVTHPERLTDPFLCLIGVRRRLDCRKELVTSFQGGVEQLQEL